MPDDNWKHRSEGMRCKTCIWWVRKGPTPLGRCRKRAPTLNGWPAVFETDWCGDHKLDEARLEPAPGPCPA
jgi:hypothetical protein